MSLAAKNRMIGNAAKSQVRASLCICLLYVLNVTLQIEIMSWCSFYFKSNALTNFLNYLIFRLLQTSKIQCMASKSSMAEHLMIRLFKGKSPNCLTAYINWPMGTLELR